MFYFNKTCYTYFSLCFQRHFYMTFERVQGLSDHRVEVPLHRYSSGGIRTKTSGPFHSPDASVNILCLLFANTSNIFY